jgi:hypothetical protein
MAGVEDGGQLVFGDDLIELVGQPIVGKEALASETKPSSPPVMSAFVFYNDCMNLRPRREVQ